MSTRDKTKEELLEAISELELQLDKKEEARMALQVSVERYRAVEESLNDSLARNKALIGAIPDLMFVFDSECRFVDYHAEKPEDLYSDPEFFLGKKPEEVLPSDIAIMTEGRVKEILKTGKPDFSTYDLEIAGELRHFESRGVKYGEEHVLSIIRDITDLKRVSESNRESEERYRSILIASPDSISITDLHGRVLLVSPVALKILGYNSEGELIGRPITDFIIPSDVERALKNIGLMHQGIMTGPAEYSGLRKDGSIFSIEVNAEFILGANGKPDKMVFIIRDISARKQTADALKESIKKYRNDFMFLRSILDSPVDIIVFALDKNYCYTTFTKCHKETIKKIWGVEIEVGMNMLEIISDPADRNRARNNFDRALAGEYFVQIEEYGDAKLHRSFYEDYYSAIKDSDDSIVGVSVFVVDITERVKAEWHRDQQLMFARALNQIAEVIITKDKAEDIFESSNRIIGETLKLDRALIYDISFEKNRINSLCEWTGGNHPDIIPTKGKYTSLEQFAGAFHTIRNTKSHIESHHNAINKHFYDGNSGEVLHKQLNIKSLIWYPFAFNEHGYYLFSLNKILESRAWTTEEFIFLESVAKQVSLALMKIEMLEERKRSENQLRRLSRAVEQSPVSIIISGADGNIAYGNPRLGQTTGYAIEELIGKNPRIFQSGETPKETYLNLWETILSGKEWKGEFHNKRKNGELYWESATISPVLDGDGKIAEFLAVKEDITEWKNMVSSLEEAKDKAEAGNRLKTAFINNISHEVRTPLNGILGFSNLITQHDISVEERTHFYSLIKLSSYRLLRTITNYMDISLIASGNLEIRRNSFDADSLLLRLYNRFHPLCRDKNLGMHFETPLKTKNVRINSDAELFQTLISHLLDNALSFTINGDITLGYNIQDGFLEFYVKDTGIGIAQKFLSEIFESFTQAGLPPAGIHVGSGLGLSIAHGLAGLLGGNIRVESKEGQGSTFYFTVPYESLDEGPVSREEENQVIPLQTRPVILVAEDDESNLLFIKAILKGTDIKILIARNGKEAIDLCHEHPEISLVLMDLKMPVMNGFEATRQIRLFRKILPVIAVTAFALSGDEKRAIEAGCSDYFPKPFDKEALLGKLSRYGIKL